MLGSMQSRSRIVFVLVGLLLGFASGSAVLDAKGGKKMPRWKKGQQKGTVEIKGKQEAFVALVPRGYSAKKKWPVVLLAHGNGGKAASFLQVIKAAAGKKPPLLISLERCDNNQDAVGYVPLYLAGLHEQFSIDKENVYALGFSGGGFRLWDDIVAQAEELPKYRGVILVGSAKQSFDPPPKPAKAPTILLVGDPRDSNFGRHRVEGEKALKEKGYEVLVYEHKGGHRVPPKEMKKVFEWIDQQIRASKKKRKKK